MEKAFKKINDLIGFRYFLIIMLICTGVLQFMLMQGNVKGDTYDFQVSQLAPETIRATKTVEDTVKTEQDRARAVKEVTPVYEFSEDVAANQAALVALLFDDVIDIKNNKDTEGNTEPLNKQIDHLKKELQAFDEEQFPISFNDHQLQLLLTQKEADLQLIRDKLAKQVEQYLQKPIRKEYITQAKNEFESKILQQFPLYPSMMDVLVTIGRASIVETELVNKTLTDERITQAKESVEPTRILQGQIIVHEGQVIDREVYHQLELLGMLNNKVSNSPIIGVFIFIMLQMIFLYAVFERWEVSVSKKQNAFVVTVIVYLLSIIIMKLMSFVVGNFDVKIAFMYPTALLTMLLRLLTTDRITAIVTVISATSAGVLFQQGYSSVLQMDMALYIILGGFASLFLMRSLENRVNILQASAVVTFINVLFITFYLLMTQSGYAMMEWLFYAGAGITSGILSGALTIGLLPFFESAFGLLSKLRLLELTNPNHPLLKKLLVETPGTYHHSVMVANLAEAACEAIGADGLLARVGCYYHDIGKTKRPQFFIENQIAGVNPHDALEPEQSAKIILAHTTDGATLLAKYKMPQEIIDIALQHHGTGQLKFFLHKARQQGKQLDENLFRYKGPKPMTKEAAVISVADSVEAAVRSMKEPTVEKISKLVKSIIEDRLAENQFDECELSIKEIKTVQRVLCETLNGIFHSRIEYPKADTI